jgi:hypothetical protein
MHANWAGEATTGLQSDFDSAVEAFREALGPYLKGDPKPAMELLSRREDVTLANPLGPPCRGPAEVGKAAAADCGDPASVRPPAFNDVRLESSPAESEISMLATRPMFAERRRTSSPKLNGCFASSNVPNRPRPSRSPRDAPLPGATVSKSRRPQIGRSIQHAAGIPPRCGSRSSTQRGVAATVAATNAPPPPQAHRGARWRA